MRVLVTSLLGALAVLGHAQGGRDTPAVVHARIDSLYMAGHHAGAISAIEEQVERTVGTPWQDSIAGYVYRYGRSVWRAKDAEQGAQAAERLLARVVAFRGPPARMLTAYEGLSLFYYDVGRLKDCIRVDSIALVFAQQQAAHITPTKLGRAYHYLAFDLAVAGEHGRAATLELAALDAYAKADPPASLLMAESSMGVGTAYWHLGRIQDADMAYGRTLELLGEAQDPASLLLKASAFGNRGILWQAAGDLVKSRDGYLRSITIQDQVIRIATDPSMRERAIFNRTKGYVNLATIYFSVGDLARSNDLLQRAWKDRSAILEPGDPQLMRLHERFADLEQARGDHARAAEHLRSYLVAMEQAQGRRNAYYIDACWRLAVEEFTLGRPARADSLFDTALSLCRAMGDGDTGKAQELIHRERAATRVRAGRPAEALVDLRKALALAQRIFGPTNNGSLGARLEIADLLLQDGQHAQAIAHCDTVLKALQDRVDAVRSGVAPRPVMSPALLPDALFTRVSAQRSAAMKGLDAEWSDGMDLAIASLRRNKAVISDADSRLRLIAAQERLFDLALDIAYEQYQRKPDTAAVQRFLDLTEIDRSTLLKARLDQFTGMRFAGVPDAVVAREDELMTAMEAAADSPDLAHELDRVEHAYVAFLDSLRIAHPRYYELRHGERTIPLHEVRNTLLDDGRNLLVHAFTTEHLYALIIRPDTCALVRMPATGVKEEVEALDKAILARDADRYLQHAHAVYRKVLAPAAGMLTGDELLVVPDGVLHKVNFESLLDEPATLKGMSHHLLLRRFAIAQLLSVTTAMQYTRIRRERPRGVLALAPGFSDEMKRTYLAQVPDTNLLDRAYLAYVRQPFAVKAVNELRDGLAAHAMVGMAANEHDFRRLAGAYGILHLGTHAEINPSAPMYSRLVLSKGLDSAGSDGYLHAYELYELDLRAQLAVLTACETGTGRNDDGEGVRSLGHAFAYAGCPSLVMSLWKIDEKVSSEIIAGFYRYLSEGMPKHKALRQAKLDHLDRARDELALPYYWAGMVLVGDVGPVHLPFWPRYRWWIIGGALAALAAFGWWRATRARPTA